MVSAAILALGFVLAIIVEFGLTVMFLAGALIRRVWLAVFNR